MYAEAVYDDLIGEISDELADKPRPGDPGRRLTGPHHPRSGRRVCQTCRAQLWCAREACPTWPADWTVRCSSGCPASRFCAAASGTVPPHERDWGTAAAVTAAVLGGAHIIRVHAVAEMVQVIRVAEAIRQAGLVGDPWGNGRG